MMGTRAIDDITAFVESGEILVGVRSPSPTWLMIDAWDTARRFAFAQDATGQEVWTDLRERFAGELVVPSIAAPKELKERIAKLRDRYSARLADRLGVTPAGRLRAKKAGMPPHPAGEFFDDILADLSILAEARLLGVALPLFEEMFVAYRAGGWPCGWEGTYPDGRLVVFAPSMQR